MEWAIKRTIQLITPEQYRTLEMGTKLIDIFGETKVKSPNSDDPNSPNYIDQDTRGGYLAYGLDK